MRFNEGQINLVQAAAKSLSMAAAAVTVEEFYGTTLGLTSTELVNYFPRPDLGDAAIAVSHLTLCREEILRDEAKVPTFVVYEAANDYCIAGISTYYHTISPRGADYPSDFLERLTQASAIRSHLLAFDKGQKLEALAAALLASICATGDATKGSGDQGIDAIGTNHLIRIDPLFLDGIADNKRVLPGQKVIVLASAKANLKAAVTGTVDTISPAHIREIIGGWLIQRSEASMWRHLGIQMLTPLQLLLVTTYKLSSNSKAYCNRLGVQVWGIPELTYLICKFGLPNLFPASRGFSAAEFDNWWGLKDGARIYPQAA